MPKFTEEMERLTSANKRINELREIICFTPRNEHEKIAAATTEKAMLNLESMFIHENAKYLFAAEYMPKVKEILSLFNGKKYGPKTKETIRETMRKELNVGFWIDQNSYSSYIHIYPLNSDGYYDHLIKDVCAYTHDTEKFLLTPDNKINVTDYPFTDCISQKEYIYNTHGAALDVIGTIEKVKATERQLNSQIDDLNKILPGGISLDKSYINYPNF